MLRAARAGDAPFVDLLLKHKALVDLPSKEGVTPLMAAGATALKAEPEAKLSPTEALEKLNWQAPAPTKADRRAEAKAKGYEGEMCGECGNFTLVRNGTCMKCDTCGSTTGCS